VAAIDEVVGPYDHRSSEELSSATAAAASEGLTAAGADNTSESEGATITATWTSKGRTAARAEKCSSC